MTEHVCTTMNEHCTGGWAFSHGRGTPVRYTLSPMVVGVGS
jgi:hypothetical protein